jgi:hypothetical protein
VLAWPRLCLHGCAPNARRAAGTRTPALVRWTRRDGRRRGRGHRARTPRQGLRPHAVEGPRPPARRRGAAPAHRRGAAPAGGRARRTRGRPRRSRGRGPLHRRADGPPRLRRGAGRPRHPRPCSAGGRTGRAWPPWPPLLAGLPAGESGLGAARAWLRPGLQATPVAPGRAARRRARAGGRASRRRPCPPGRRAWPGRPPWPRAAWLACWGPRPPWTPALVDGRLAQSRRRPRPRGVAPPGAAPWPPVGLGGRLGFLTLAATPHGFAKMGLMGCLGLVGPHRPFRTPKFIIFCL